MPFLLGNSRSNSITGTGLQDTMLGEAGNDTLNGAGGADLILGQADNDSLLGGTGNDSIVGGTQNDTLVGGFDADTMKGEAGDDFLSGVEIDGPAANDSLLGGLDNDFYFLGNSGDKIVELNGEGRDTVVASFDFALPANFEELRLTGAIGRAMTGNTIANRITGSTGDDTLDGVAGQKFDFGGDTLSGGTGDDLYRIHRLADVVTEGFNQGVDLIESPFGLTTPANFEGLRLLGTANLNAKTNATGSGIAGNLGNNLLEGGAGEDRLLGNGGSDTMLGGAGEDLIFHHEREFEDDVASLFVPGIFVDGGGDGDFIIGGQGRDTLLGGDGGDLIASGNAFTGPTTSPLIAIGCAAANLFSGSFDGAIECNGGGLPPGMTVTLLIAAGDSVLGGAGNDTIGGDLSNDTIRGGLDSDSLMGNDGNDLLFGESGGDTLKGGNGRDTMDGGDGNDTYFVDATNDVVIEDRSGGVDTIISTVDRSMRENPENLILMGEAKFGGGNARRNRLEGNARNNELLGNEGRDTLLGGSGDDQLEGGSGEDRLRGFGGANGEIDTLVGGAGKDVFVLGMAEEVSYVKLGRGDYAVLADFNTSHRDRLQLSGRVGDYVIGATRSGAELFLDTNENRRLDSQDNLLVMADGLSTQSLSDALSKARFV